MLGRGAEDIESLGEQLPYQFSNTDAGMPRIKTVGGDVSPVAVSAEILKVLVERANESPGR